MNLRGFRQVWSLGLGTWGLILLLSVMPATGNELKNYMVYRQLNQTQLVLEFAAPVQAQVREDGLDVVLVFPDLALEALPREIDVGSPQVIAVRVDATAGEIRVLRSKLLPYDVETQDHTLVLTIRDVLSEEVPVESVAAPQPAPQTTPEPQPAPAPVAAPTARQAGPVTIQAIELQALASTHVTVRLRMPRTESVQFQWSRIENPVRWILDLQPAVFMPGHWKMPLDPGSWVREIRAAQFQAQPQPVTRLVFELETNTGNPETVWQDNGLLIRLHREEAPSGPVATPTEASVPAAEAERAQEPAPREAAPSVLEARSTEATPETPSTPTEEASAEQPVPAPAPETTSAAASEPETQPEAAPPEPAPEAAQPAASKDTQSEGEVTPVPASPAEEKAVAAAPQKAETEAWDARFFSEKDLAFYQAAEADQADQAAKRAQELAIFKERTLVGQKKYEGEVVTLDFVDIHVKDLMMFFSDISGLNIVLDPAIEGPQYQIPVLRLSMVPWDQALDLVCRMLGLGYVLEGNVLRVAPVDVLAREAEERQKLQEEVGELQTVIKPLSFASAEQVRALAEQLLTPRGQIMIDSRTNTLIIKEIDTNMQNILNLIDTLDTPIPQVNIEARIIQTRRTYSQALGIQWGFRGLVSPEFGNQTSLIFPNNIQVFGNTLVSQTGGISGNPLEGYAVNLPTQQAPNAAVLLSFGSVMDTFRLDAAIMALENAGLARVLSSPRVSTQNNKEAEIKSGFQIPVQTIVNNTIQVTYVDATLRLLVTPQITADGSVIMQVKVENRRPDFTQPVLGIPPIITQEASTTLLVKDGSTAVLGGIIQSTDEINRSRVPFLHRIPILGWLFKNRNINRTNDELLIFLTPRVVK